MFEPILVNNIFDLHNTIPVIDVRSEGEFASGNMVGSINIPLLNNDERALVGTCYKKSGNKKAVILGYELVGKKFASYVTYVTNNFKQKKIIVYCWRGGLRSRIMADLLSTAGYKVYQLKGGYKSYRNFVLNTFEKPFNFNILGGFTGSNKTEILEILRTENLQVINLEKIANHRGSAYGSLGLGNQPTQEQFENNLAQALLKLDLNQPIWIEDEGRTIGNKVVPLPIFNKIRNNTLYFLDYEKEFRVNNILKQYGSLEADDLIFSTLKLVKKLGDLRTKQCVESIQSGNLHVWVNEVLKYYDKTYLEGLSKREPNKVLKLNLTGNALIEKLKNIG